MVDTTTNISSDTIMDIFNTMFLFRLFQNGLLFTSIVAGFLSIVHIFRFRQRLCENAIILLVLLGTGFINMIVLAYFLQLSDRTSFVFLSRGSTPQCYDFSLPATISNSIILSAVIGSVITQNIRPAKAGKVVWCLMVGCITGGLGLICLITYNSSMTVYDDRFLTIGNINNVHLDVFWSICPNNIHESGDRLWTEYGLIYFPMVIAVFFASIDEKEGINLRALKIINTQCCVEEDEICVCSKFGPSFVAVMLYSVVLLLIVRPIHLMTSLADDGVFRDIIPSLLHSVLYCFVCSEYIGTLLSQLRPRHKSDTTSRTEQCKMLHV
ncbi:hypothetical protein ACF0H5_008804 [Mactra antiquata]